MLGQSDNQGFCWENQAGRLSVVRVRKLISYLEAMLYFGTGRQPGYDSKADNKLSAGIVRKLNYLFVQLRSQGESRLLS